MNWDAVAAIAEALAVLGVIASLIYVALQVRQNSKLIDQSILATRSAMVHEISVSFARFFDLNHFSIFT
jgi:cation transporter-like permease